MRIVMTYAPRPPMPQSSSAVPLLFLLFVVILNVVFASYVLP
jgi:hypothetical protein